MKECVEFANNPIVLRLFAVLGQIAAAQHGHQGQRHNGRHQDRQRHHNRKFSEQQANGPGHEEDRNKHRHQRDGNRDDGKAHFLAAFQGGFERVHALFHIAHDVLKHHDGVVHHQAHSQGNAQQRHVV